MNIWTDGHLIPQAISWFIMGQLSWTLRRRQKDTLGYWFCWTSSGQENPLIVVLNVAKMSEHKLLSPQIYFGSSCFTHCKCGWCNFIMHASSWLWIFMVSSVLTLICRGVCSGPWDVVCFIDHLMILVLCYISNSSFVSFLDFFLSFPWVAND